MESHSKNTKESSIVATNEAAIPHEGSSVHSVHSSTTIHTKREDNANADTHDNLMNEKLSDTTHDQAHLHDPNHAPAGHGESAIPADKKEEEMENLQDDWEDDPANARNWSFSKKWTCVAIVSLYTFLSPLSSSMLAPGLPDIATRYGVTSTTETSLMLSVFLVSFALGPLILAPLSEMYGRTWILHFGTFFSLAFNIGCAFAPNAGAFIGFRFLNGFSGSAPIACGGGSIGDLFSERDRASAMAIYSLGPLIGPAVGPVAGGFIAQTIGPKYVFIVIAAACGVSLVVGVPLLKETYAPVIRLRRARAEGDLEKAKHFHGSMSNMSKWEYLWLNLSRPVILLSRSFICFILSLYMAFMYGIYYLMFTTFPELFNGIYGFDTGIGGLVYLGLGIGFLVATMFGAKTADQIYHYLASKNGGKGKPEMRIPALAFGSLWVPVGLFWYGWSAQARIHWIMPIIGSGIFGFGMMTTFLPIQLYLVDAFQFAASALAAASVMRSLLGFAFPLFGTQMYHALGYGGGNSLLGGLAIVLGIPFPIWIYYKGEQMRARNPLTRT
ncbi:major facilitator superfamily domain-containing protein [Lentinula raphanica]|nr:major facilitator superfamily domain-containing protein [Lentinula raphanica]KAJ3970880.1 major facilitator superfamily domain-containing protein [Lentinula raphanica]